MNYPGGILDTIPRGTDPLTIVRAVGSRLVYQTNPVADQVNIFLGNPTSSRKERGCVKFLNTWIRPVK